MNRNAKIHFFSDIAEGKEKKPFLAYWEMGDKRQSVILSVHGMSGRDGTDVDLTGVSPARVGRNKIC